MPEIRMMLTSSILVFSILSQGEFPSYLDSLVSPQLHMTFIYSQFSCCFSIVFLGCLLCLPFFRYVKSLSLPFNELSCMHSPAVSLD